MNSKYYVGCDEYRTRVYQFIKMIADMTQDGEEVDGEEFIMENDDAVSTVNGLIDEARSILGRKDG